MIVCSNSSLTAMYGSGDDAFYFGFGDVTRRSRKALLIHEAVRAAMDLVGANQMTIHQSEAIAYVAQCL